MRTAFHLHSNRAAIEHIIERYVVDAYARNKGKPPFAPTPGKSHFDGQVTPEMARRAITRYEEGVADHLRLVSELDAALKLDPDDPKAIRMWQHQLRVYAAERRLKDEAEVEGHALAHKIRGLPSMIIVTLALLFPAPGVALSCHCNPLQDSRQPRLRLTSRAYAGRPRGAGKERP